MRTIKKLAQPVLLCILLISGSAYAADSILGFVSAIGLYDNGSLTVSGVSNFLGSLIASKPIQQPVSTAATMTSITTPSSGAAPSGSLQITAAYTYVTSCPTPGSGQQNAAQVTTLPGQVQTIVNGCTTSWYLYPVASGILSAQSANTPLLIDPYAVVTLYGKTSTSTGFTDVIHNFEWSDVTAAFSIPAMAAFTCASPVTITEPKAMVGDSIIATGAGTTLPSDNIAVSFEVTVMSAGNLQIKPCNIANTGLNSSTAISGAVLNLRGLGNR